MQSCTFGYYMQMCLGIMSLVGRQRILKHGSKSEAWQRVRTATGFADSRIRYVAEIGHVVIGRVTAVENTRCQVDARAWRHPVALSRQPATRHAGGSNASSALASLQFLKNFKP